MKKFLIAGSSLASVAAAGSVGAVDVTLGGSIDMGVEFGLGKNYENLVFDFAYNQITLSLSAAGTTDGGLMFGGSFTLGTATEIEFKPYASEDGSKYLAQKTNNDRTDILGHAYYVSGGGAVDVADIVSVKINSDWLGIDSDAVQNIFPIGTSFSSSAICKIAGRGHAGAGFLANTPNQTFFSPIGPNIGPNISGGIAAGDYGWATKANFAAVANGSYLPAGRLILSITTVVVEATKNATPKAGNPWKDGFQTIFIGGMIGTSKGALGIAVGNATHPASKVSAPFGGGNKTAVAYNDKGFVVFDYWEYANLSEADVTSAAIYAGPFMEVAMASSSTKMVVGALCLDGNEESGTAFYMDNASKVMTVSDASIYIEGGFGKLSLQNSDYTGGVSAIAGAGDQADIEADGWVIAAEGYGLMGANPFIAMDLSKGDSLGDIEVITGGTFDLGSLALAFDVALDNPTDVLGISSWDLGATYAMGDLALGFATDSSSDWGLSADMDIAGFGVSAVFGSSSAGDHEKSGITYVVTATTALNGYNLAIGFDQSLKPALGIDYDLGGLNLYAYYDAVDEGGSVGATLSF